MPLGLKSSALPFGGGLSKPRSGSSRRPCELACPGLGIRIERVEEAFVQAPAGARFSGGGDPRVVNGGKSVGCNATGDICWDGGKLG